MSIVAERKGRWVREAFPLHMRTELEVPLNKMAYVIGVNSDYPARLREMLSAAAITYQLANKSIDNVRRTYLKDMSYEEDPGGNLRIDRTIRRESLELAAAAKRYLVAYPPLINREPLMGEWIADLTLTRVAYSIERAYAEADKGALYESVAIARMALEQSCWAYTVRSLNDREAIVETPIGRAITATKQKFTTVGRLYGWMSKHAHWNHDAHVKVISFDADFYSTILSSSLFKAIAYSGLILVTDVYRQIVDDAGFSNRNKALSAARKEWASSQKRFRPTKWLRTLRSRLRESEDVAELADIHFSGRRQAAGGS